MMSRKPSVALALALVASGCSAPDPLNVRLNTGTLAVVVAGERPAILVGSGASERPELAPGVAVRVGDDPGEWRESKGHFDAVLELKSEDLTEAERKAGPRTFAEGHPKARFRLVRVVVESGEHRGMAGSVGRLHLMPAP